MSSTRREFLRGSAAAALVASTPAVPSIWAAASRCAAETDGDRILVVVQLTGGNDGLNTLIPHGDDVYQRSRHATRIDANAVLKIDDYLGWHPALRGLADLQQAGALCAVQGVGYPNPNRSHFESMDIWHSAQLDGPHRTGWLGRHFDSQPRDRNAIPGLHLGDEPLPLALTGLNVMVPSLKGIESLQLSRRAAARLVERAHGTDESRSALLEYVAQARQTALDASRRLEQAASGLGRDDEFPRSGLGRKLSQVAQLIEIDFGPRVYYVTLAGFDTHSQQPEAHRALLTELSDAVAAFCKALQTRAAADRVLTVCFSEFGRRVEENGSRGTDHGTAAPMLIAGPSGLPPLAGRYPSLTDLDQGDLRFSVDFRSVYATLLARWLGVDSQAILGQAFDEIPLLG